MSAAFRQQSQLWDLGHSDVMFKGLFRDGCIYLGLPELVGLGGYY